MELVDTKKMMRSSNAICLLVVAFIVAAAAFTTTQAQEAEATAAAAAPGPAGSAPAASAAAAGPASAPNSAPASPAALEFLRGRCTPGVMPKVIASLCYDSLLPQAGSFNGSCIRVIGAATELMAANFRSFHAELRRLDGAKYKKLGKCADQAAEFAGGEKKEPEKLAKIRDLAAMGDDDKVESVYDLVSWMNDVDQNFQACQKEMTAVPDADKLLPTKAMYYSILVAEGLINGYTPPGSQM